LSEEICKTSDEAKTRKQLKSEMTRMSQRITGLEEIEVEHKRAEMELKTDIAQRKRMERNLSRHVESLGDLVEKNTKKTGKLLQMERLAAIGETAAMVGHDLRNPLTGIAGAAYYLRTNWGRMTDEKSMQMLSLIEKNVEYSNKIIDDLLEYSAEIYLEVAETDPKSLVGEALALAEVPKKIRVLDSTEKKPRMQVDLQRIRRCLVNIIDNAVEAMPQGGKLTITSKESNGNCEMTFIDTGEGMEEEIIEKLWNPLFTTKAKGIGLGLSICKRIVEAHGGTISVKSRPGEGTAFTISLPIKPESEEDEFI